MRPARKGKERNVVRLMNLGKRDEAIAYMKANGMIQAFAGAPEWKPVSTPEKPLGMAKAEEYKYPDFLPKRDPLPAGVVYARIRREMAHGLQKVITFIDDDELPEHRRREALLWMGSREQEAALRRGRLIGQVFAIEPNPDELQGGYRVWRP